MNEIIELIGVDNMISITITLSIASIAYAVGGFIYYRNK